MFNLLIYVVWICVRLVFNLVFVFLSNLCVVLCVNVLIGEVILMFNVLLFKLFISCLGFVLVRNFVLNFKDGCEICFLKLICFVVLNMCFLKFVV